LRTLGVVRTLTPALLAGLLAFAPGAQAQVPEDAHPGEPPSATPAPTPSPPRAPPPPVPHWSASAPPGTDYPSPTEPPPPPVSATQTVDVSGAPPAWKPGDPIPPGYREARYVRKGLVVGGSVIFVASYFFSVVASLTAEAAQDGCPENAALDGNFPGCHPPLTDLLIPGVGPFIQMAHSWNTPLGDVLLGLDGVAQIVGLTMFTIGLVARDQVIVRTTLASKGDLRLSLAPLVTRGGRGMAIVGSF
jgi:hypothetical protein